MHVVLCINIARLFVCLDITGLFTVLYPHVAEDKQGRLIEPVKKRSRHILCQLCTSEGS